MNQPYRTARIGPLFTVAITCALGLVLGCIDTPNGSTFSGSNIGRVVHLGGFALSAGDTITVEVLADANANPDSSSSTWIAIGTTSASTSPITWVGDELYPFSIDVIPVPTWFLGGRWPAGGLVRMRAKNGSGNLVQTFDDTDCYGEALGDVKKYIDIYNECKSHDTPILTFVDEDPVPNPDPAKNYLTLRQNAAAESQQYYNTINAPSTLSSWIASRGFPVGETVTRYYNRGDLGIGREMHCRSGFTFPGTAPPYACYVTNYGNAADGLADATSALVDTVNGNNPFATVAMDYWPQSLNKVRFYVYGANGQLVTQAALDSTGAKPIPGLCLSCHGGVYNASSNTVSGAKFLPFDLEAFNFVAAGSNTKSAQQDKFRILNKMVRDNDPGNSTIALIDGWYGGSAGVSTPGTIQNPKYAPAGWADEPVVYEKVVAPYCRTCHVSVGFPMDTSAQFKSLNVKNAVCEGKYMPHAEVTRKSFWASSGRAHIVGALDIADACN